MRLHPFYPIFDGADWFARALPRGVRFAQLRIKEMAADRLRVEIATCQKLCDQHGAVLVVNDHWELAIELGCTFVHLGQEDLDDADLDAIRRANIRLGISTHDPAELDRALSY
ncbi:MAG: thiamine phosphate synthase, partial [Pseudomonadota bacterium]